MNPCTVEHAAAEAVSAVAKWFDVGVERIRGRGRTREEAEARMAARVIVLRLGFSARLVGRAFGNEHKMALWSRDRVADLIGADGVFRFRFDRAWSDTCRSLKFGGGRGNKES